MTTWLAAEQLPDDIGKAGPFGLLLMVLGLIAVAFLVRSMARHLRRVPRNFGEIGQESRVVVPDTPEELLQQRPVAGEDLLETLRRAPRAIEPPRRDDGERGPGTAG